MKKVSEFKYERELQEDLAECLSDRGDLTFTEIQLPHMNSSRADVIAMTPHRYSTKNIRIYEVKLNRNAWSSDEKFQKYLQCCNSLYIACPKGLIKKAEIPEGLGLITRSDNGWRVVKSPRLNINPPKLDVDFILSLLYRGIEESKSQRDLRERIIADSNASSEAQANKIGWEISRRISRSKEGQIIKWAEEIWNIFERYGFEKPKNLIQPAERFYNERINLPSTYELENILSSAAGLLDEANTIKAIGKFLDSLDLPESGEYWRGTRKYHREKALNMIENYQKIKEQRI